MSGKALYYFYIITQFHQWERQEDALQAEKFFNKKPTYVP